MMSRGVPFASGEFGNTDLNFRRGDCASSASVADKVPDFIEAFIRLCKWVSCEVDMEFLEMGKHSEAVNDSVHEANSAQVPATIRGIRTGR